MTGSKFCVPLPLRAEALALAHYPTPHAHSGSTLMYQTLRREFYWPHTVLDTPECVLYCTSCEKERINLRIHSQFMRSFYRCEAISVRGFGHPWSTDPNCAR